jgi:hypothetical protein
MIHPTSKLGSPQVLCIAQVIVVPLMSSSWYDCLICSLEDFPDKKLNISILFTHRKLDAAPMLS